MSPFDVVVIGAGSAGCVVTNRLCQDGQLGVCLIEAGPDYGAANSGHWPPELLDPRQRPMTHDWGYLEVRADGSTLPEPRGKVVGGCSAHNPCAAVWGLPEDYDSWGASGNPGWTYADLKPLFAGIEDDELAVSAYHGRGGAVPTRPYRDDELASWQQAFLGAAMAAGFPRIVDLSAPDPAEGVAPFHANVKDSLRWNAAFAFLDPVRTRSNLTILSDTMADRLVIRQDRAVALVCRSGDESVEVEAERFVLSAGTYGSPAILMRSGIGPAGHLAEIGIPVQIALSGVGQNLHDHPGIRVRFTPSSPGQRALEEDLAIGRFHQSQVILRAKSTPAVAGFDLHLLPYHSLTDSSWSFAILAYNMVPRPRGQVLLRDTDLESPPWIDFQFLTDPSDRDIGPLIEGLQLIRRLATTDPLAKTISWEIDPGPRVSRPVDVRGYIRSVVAGYAHPVGTCKMGPASDPSAVVDASGRVHGTANVFVADASIMPQIPRANTNFTSMLIGFRIGDVLAHRSA